MLFVSAESEVDLSISCSQKSQTPVTPSAPTSQPGPSDKPGTKLPSSNSPAVLNTSQGSRPITAGGPITPSGSVTTSAPISTDGSVPATSGMLDSSTDAYGDTNNTVGGVSDRTPEQTTPTNRQGPKNEDDESLEYYKGLTLYK